MKVETVNYTQEIENCGECNDCGCAPTAVSPYCWKLKRIIRKDIWKGFPKWCPLEVKDEKPL